MGQTTSPPINWGRISVTTVCFSSVSSKFSYSFLLAKAPQLNLGAFEAFAIAPSTM